MAKKEVSVKSYRTKDGKRVKQFRRKQKLAVALAIGGTGVALVAAAKNKKSAVSIPKINPYPNTGKAREALKTAKDNLTKNANLIKDGQIERGFVINKKGKVSKIIEGKESSIFIGKTDFYGNKIPFGEAKAVVATVHNHPNSRLTSPSPADLSLDLKNKKIGVVVAKDGTKHVYRRGNKFNTRLESKKVWDDLLTNRAVKIAESYPDFGDLNELTQNAIKVNTRQEILKALNKKQLIRYQIRDKGKFQADPSLAPYTVDIKSSKDKLNWSPLSEFLDELDGKRPSKATFE